MLQCFFTFPWRAAPRPARAPAFSTSGSGRSNLDKLTLIPPTKNYPEYHRQFGVAKGRKAMAANTFSAMGFFKRLKPELEKAVRTGS
jgi:hypothetical protein